MSVLIYLFGPYTKLDYHPDGSYHGSRIPSTNAKRWYMVVDHVTYLLNIIPILIPPGNILVFFLHLHRSLLSNDPVLTPRIIT